jgi:hypothetical protein
LWLVVVGLGRAARDRMIGSRVPIRIRYVLVLMCADSAKLLMK